MIHRTRNCSKVIILCLFCLTINKAKGQETPINPVSCRIFTPYFYNPAIAGSKDFLSAEAIASFHGKYKSQVLSLNGRFTKYSPSYVTTTPKKEYINVGGGGFIFNDVSAASKSIGAGLALSYHIPVSKSKTSFISIGASFKGVYNSTSLISTESETTTSETYFPNCDFGIYYYSPRVFTGISAVNILGKPDTIGNYSIPVSREYFITAGYKFVLSSKRNIILEPSLILNTDDSLSFSAKELLKPMLKLYVDRVCIGTFFNNYDYFSFFFQYNYPALYLGAFIEYPIGTPYYKKELFAEISLGINFSGKKLRKKERVHW